jgi:phosphocarrier protein HPr
VAEPVVEIEVEIQNAEGLHMRPAMQFVDLAGRFASSVTVSNNDVSADAKSIMQMTMLAAGRGSRLKIRAQGSDAAQAVAALKDLVEKKFPAPGNRPAESKKEG